MANRLKRLIITSVDLCRRGANPLARIALSKSKDGAPELRARLEELLRADMDDAALLREIRALAGVDEPAQEQAAGNADAEAKAPRRLRRRRAEDAQYGGEVHPEVRKALGEVQALRQGLERERLMGIAKRYDGLCGDAGELAGRLEGLKAAGGSAYDDYVALLDELSEARRVEPFMKEYGTSRGADCSLDMRVAAIMRAEPGLTRAQAVVKAYQADPELPEII